MWKIHTRALIAALPVRPALATCAPQETLFATCQIAGAAKSLSLCLNENEAFYRFGSAAGPPRLTLRSPFADLEYRITHGMAGTAEDQVVFYSGDHARRVPFGFQSQRQPDPTELHPWRGGAPPVAGDRVP